MHRFALFILVLFLFACESETSAPAMNDVVADISVDVGNDVPAPPVDELRLNEIQVFGTHNSYHVATPTGTPETQYTHPPLTTQLETHGVRQLELDVYAMNDGVDHVYHGPFIDEGSTCETLPTCLAEVAAWSAANPAHVPVLVIIEMKSITGCNDVEDILARDYYTHLDSVLLDAFPRASVIAPDDVRGDHATLREALEVDGWPPLAELRGRVLFVLNTTSARAYMRDAYLHGTTALEGRLMFVRDGRDEPWGAILERGNPVRDYDEIVSAVADGYLVRTTADESLGSDEENAAGREAALSSGAHFISTDFEEPREEGYWFDWPAPAPARCNPRSAPEACLDSWFE